MTKRQLEVLLNSNYKDNVSVISTVGIEVLIKEDHIGSKCFQRRFFFFLIPAIKRMFLLVLCMLDDKNGW